MSGIYWAITSLFIMKKDPMDVLDVAQILSFVLDCYDDSVGGFSPNASNDVHILSTLSALQILTLLKPSAIESDMKMKIYQCKQTNTLSQLIHTFENT